MNKLTIFFFILFLTVSTSAQKSKTLVKQSYDRFRDETALTLWIDIKPSLSIIFISTFTGKKITSKNNLISTIVNSKNKNTLYRYSNDLIFLLDGNRLKLNNGKYSVERARTLIVEDINFFYFQDTLKQIVDAEKVEAKIGETEFTFTESQLQSIRDFYSRLVPQSSSVIK